MAKVHAQVVGGSIKEITADKVSCVKSQMDAKNYTALVNGDPADDNDALRDYDFVTLAPAVKGAN